MTAHGFVKDDRATHEVQPAKGVVARAAKGQRAVARFGEDETAATGNRSIQGEAAGRQVDGRRSARGYREGTRRSGGRRTRVGECAALQEHGAVANGADSGVGNGIYTQRGAVADQGIASIGTAATQDQRAGTEYVQPLSGDRTGDGGGAGGNTDQSHGVANANGGAASIVYDVSGRGEQERVRVDVGGHRHRSGCSSKVRDVT